MPCVIWNKWQKFPKKNIPNLWPSQSWQNPKIHMQCSWWMAMQAVTKWSAIHNTFRGRRTERVTLGTSLLPPIFLSRDFSILKNEASRDAPGRHCRRISFNYPVHCDWAHTAVSLIHSSDLNQWRAMKIPHHIKYLVPRDRDKKGWHWLVPLHLCLFPLYQSMLYIPLTSSLSWINNIIAILNKNDLTIFNLIRQTVWHGHTVSNMILH